MPNTDRMNVLVNKVMGRIEHDIYAGEFTALY